ncbi:MAG: folylpolyglutamate synthase/dihydrofolate synthase family protein [Pseudomonadota bacterium]
MNFSIQGTSSLDEALRAIISRRPKLIDLSLDRIFRTLGKLGDPHKALPPTFHVAGTNGKGSTIAFLRSILEASGKRCHVYTSPHLVRYNERIVLAGHEISDEHFIDCLRKCDDAAGEDELTFFETVTCAAFVAFAETTADFLLLEVGLGGRLDATNVIDHPLAAVVTSIGMDHQAFLGDTLPDIAREKAGIFKRDVPAVVGVQDPDSMAALLTRIGEVDAVPFTYGQEWTFWPEAGRLSYQDEESLCDLDPPRLIGPHQLANAALAVAAIRAANLSMPNDKISEGLSTASWPARMQRMSEGSLVAKRLAADEPQSGREVWLDGGHNPDAGVVVAQTLADLDERSPKPIVLIVGMQSNKDATEFLAPFAGLVRKVIATRADNDLAMAPEDVGAALDPLDVPFQISTTLEEALRLASATIDGPARFLIAGSLYLAGEVLSLEQNAAARPD